MTERIDHVGEAEACEQAALSIMRTQALGIKPDAEAALQVQLAQVHATLALVEQQRIANILTLVGDEDPETVNDNLIEVGADPVKVRADIVAAMGWS